LIEPSYIEYAGEQFLLRQTNREALYGNMGINIVLLLAYIYKFEGLTILLAQNEI